MTTQEAAKLLPRTSAATLARWARDGDVPVTKLRPSGRMLFLRSDIEALVERKNSVSEERIKKSTASADSARGVEGLEPLPGFEGV